MISRLLALFVLVGTTFAQKATRPTAATVEVWPEGKMPGKGAKDPEAEVPRNDGTPNNRAGALQDAQPALSLTRAHAAEWNIDPKGLGVIGFSAGGNLTAKTSTGFDERTYPAIDAIDQQSCRPDFAVLVYPAHLDDKNGHVAPDLNLQAQIPPTLIVSNCAQQLGG